MPRLKYEQNSDPDGWPICAYPASQVVCSKCGGWMHGYLSSGGGGWIGDQAIYKRIFALFNERSKGQCSEWDVL